MNFRTANTLLISYMITITFTDRRYKFRLHDCTMLLILSFLKLDHFYIITKQP